MSNEKKRDENGVPAEVPEAAERMRQALGSPTRRRSW